MSEFEARLSALDIGFPPTPDLAAAVEARLAAERRPGRLRRWLERPRLVLALAVLVAAFGAVLAASPGARSAFLEIFGIEGAVVYRVDELPEVTPSFPLAGLGEQVTLEQAERRAGFTLLRLGAAGEPDAVHFKEPGMVSFVYGRDLEVRLVFSQIDGRLDDVFVKKLTAGGTEVEYVTVEGERGLFITGEPHFFTYVSRRGHEEEPLYLARDVLLWERGARTLRLEGDFDRSRAFELAESVR